LPAAAAPENEEAEGAIPAPDVGTPLRNRRILIVDDNDDPSMTSEPRWQAQPSGRPRVARAIELAGGLTTPS
jgi:hypothetical protein